MLDWVSQYITPTFSYFFYLSTLLVILVAVRYVHQFLKHDRLRHENVRRRVEEVKNARSMRTQSVRDPWMRMTGSKFDVTDLTTEEKRIRNEARRAGVTARGLN